MPVLTIRLPENYLRRAKAKARSEGFRSPAAWARTVVERNLAVLRESPRLRPQRVVSAMRRTGLYREGFLRSLKRSLAYADKAA